MWFRWWFFFSQLNLTESTKQFNKENIGYTINLAKIDAIAPMDVILSVNGTNFK